MRIFTENERDYLIELIRRSMKSYITQEEVNERNGLNKPMDINERVRRSRIINKSMDTKERVRRSRIINKSMDGIHDLVLAELSGIIPSKKDIKSGQPSLELLVQRHKVNLINIIASDKKEKSKQFLSEYNYKVFSKLIEPNDSDENDDV